MNIAKRTRGSREDVILTYILAYVKEKGLTDASEISMHMETPVTITKRLGLGWGKMPTINSPTTRKSDYGFWHTRPGILENNLLVVKVKARNEVSTVTPRDTSVSTLSLYHRFAG